MVKEKIKTSLVKSDEISATVILDSVNSSGTRLTTLHLRYPRMVHSELMTHRVFSRNARSSRAVPVMTLLEEDNYLPTFSTNQSGMQPADELSEKDQEKAQKIWLELIEFTKRKVLELKKLEVHKQWSNRPLEAFGFIDVLISATDFNNFFALRDHEDAQIEIRILAQKIKQALSESTPQRLKEGEWHLPYIKSSDYEAVRNYQRELSRISESRTNQTEVFVYETLCRISAARCARISYSPFSGGADLSSELDRYLRLAGSSPVHASPLEHQAYADPNGRSPYHHGNFRGFVQFRKLKTNEYVPG